MVLSDIGYMNTLLFAIILGFILFEYLLERLLDVLDRRFWSAELPDVLKGIYDAEKYRKSQEYEKVKTRFGMVTSTFSLLLISGMLIFQGFAWLSGWVSELTGQPLIQSLLFFGILYFVSEILSIPFSYYAVFNIEERFGFNKMTRGMFISDKLKGWTLAAILGGGLLSLIQWLTLLTGPWFWLIAWAAISLFSVFMSMFYSQIIVPLFNKQKPLEEGPLREAVMEFAAKTGFRLKNIYVIDGSKRSKKANAYFTGIGSKKRIVLYDTLIADHPVAELVAVLAHEIGHYRKKHTLTGLITSLVNTGIILYIFSLVVENPVLSSALGAEKPSFHLGLLAFGLLYGPVSLLTGIGMNVISRRHEYAADRFAAIHGLSEPLQQALIRLSVNNLSNLRPHPATVFIHYSHPPLLKRLEALKSHQSVMNPQTDK